MVLTRLMARANRRQTRSMTKAAGNSKSGQPRSIAKSSRPTTRKPRVRATAAKRASNAISMPATLNPPATPVPASVPAHDEEAVASASPKLDPSPGPIDRPLEASPLSPDIEQQHQAQHFALESPLAAVQQSSSSAQHSSTLLQFAPPSNACPVQQDAESQQSAQPTNNILEQPSSSEAEVLLNSVSLDFLKPRPECEPLNPLADWRQESAASGYLGTARMLGKNPHKRVIGEKVGTDPTLYDSSSEDDTPGPKPPKPKPFVAMTFSEIEGRTKGVLNSSVAAPCSVAVKFELRKLTEMEKQIEAERVYKQLKENSIVVRNAERTRGHRRKPYFWFNKRVEKHPKDTRLRKLRREKERDMKLERLVSGQKGWEMTRCYAPSPFGNNVLVETEKADDVA